MSMTVEDGGSKQAKPVPNTPSNVLEQFKLNDKVVIVNGAADGIGEWIEEVDGIFYVGGLRYSQESNACIRPGGESSR